MKATKIFTLVLIFIFNFKLVSNESHIEHKQKNIIINFDNIHMVEYIRFISRITNKNFIFDENDLDFTVTILSEEPTTIDNAMTSLLQELRIHQLLLTEQGNQLIIHKNPQMNSSSTIITDGTSEGCSAEILTQVFHLNTLEPERATAVIRPLISANAIMDYIPQTQHLIVTDLRCNITQIARLLKHLDSPTGGLVIGQYVAVGSDLDKLQTLAQQIMAPLAKNIPLTMVASRPSNSLFIISTPFLVEKCLAILQYLDHKQNKTGILELDHNDLPQGENRPSGTEISSGNTPTPSSPSSTVGTSPSHSRPTYKPSQFYIHRLQYRQGDAILSQIKQIAASLQQVKEHEDFIATIHTGEWLRDAKSLVFSGHSDNIDKVKYLIEELDLPRRQVYIETLIINTTVDDSLNYSVNWAAQFHGDNFSGAEAFNSGANLNKILSQGDGKHLANGAGFSLGVIGQKIVHKGLGLEFGSIGALLNALHENHISNILLSPKIVTEDNIPAQFFVGVNTPFKTQSFVSENGDIITSNFEFRDVGTYLQVTPHLHNSDIITMEVFQERSDLISAPATNANARNVIGPTSRKNSTKTTVHVPSGYFVIISGLIENDSRKIKKQVPCLGSIPFLGALFKDKTTSDSQRNLMIFIRPLIIDTDDEYQNLTQQQQKVFKVKNTTPKDWVQEVDEALDFLNLNPTSP